MDKMKAHSKLKRDLENLGYQMVIQCQSILTKVGLPKNSRVQNSQTISAALLARTILNFKGVLLLSKSNQQVEMDILVRSQIENLLWLRKLKAGKEAFLAEVRAESLARDAAFARLIKDQVQNHLEPEEKEFLVGMAAQSTRANISLVVASSDTEAFREYALYRRLSAWTVHTSLRSLSRHWPDDLVGIPEFHLAGKQDHRETISTIFWATSTMMSAAEIYLEIVPDPYKKRIFEAMLINFNRTVCSPEAKLILDL
jgi:hypothetical protein